MGAPPSPPWATLFFAPHEDECCDTFADNIHFYRRFLDDVFGVWTPNEDPAIDAHNWTRFKSKMNSFHGLEWTFSDLSNTVDFMDLTIKLQNGDISMS